ncbi:MAG: hypothetical protein RL142_275 [Actinomycetota bacterium]|jgi:hypothetical protein
MAKAKAAETYEYNTNDSAADKPAEKAPKQKPAAPKYDFTKLNTLAVVSAATAATGFGAVAAVITGHVSLSQIKRSGENGRGWAIAGIAAGYTVIGLWILSTLGFIALGIYGARNGIPFGGPGGMHMDRDGDGFGQMQQFGQVEIQPMPGQQG